MSPNPDFFDRYPEFFETSRAGTHLKTGEPSSHLSNRYRAIIQSNLDTIQGSRILDIASHDGRWSLAALDAGAAHVTAVEPRASMVDDSIRIISRAGFGPSRYTPLVGDIYDIFPTFESGQFDTIFCLGFFYHTMEHFRLMKNMIELDAKSIILDTVALADDSPKIIVHEEDPAWEGSSIANTRRTDVVLKGLPTVGYIIKVVTHMGWNGHEIDWFKLGIEDWSGSEIYQKRQRRTFRLYPDENTELESKAPSNTGKNKISVTSPAWQTTADKLKTDGIATAPTLYVEEADYLRGAFIERDVEPKVDVRKGTIMPDPERSERVGNTSWLYVSLTDPVLSKILLDPDLLCVIENYYGAPPYFRRMPYVKRTCVQDHHEPDISTVYHIDQSKHFVGIMLLLSDLSETDSHMKFLAGTHEIEQADFRLKPSDPKNRDLEVELESKYRVVPLVGPKGTMFIYDNGNGIHKGHMISGTTRDVMQATYSRGDHTSKPQDKDLLAEDLNLSVAKAPELVQNSILHIV